MDGRHIGLRDCPWRHRGVGGNGTSLRLLRHVATRDNTGTTIVTFLMVFLIQRAQNKDNRAIQLKLNELVAAVEGASNRLIDAEDLTEDELELLHRFYTELVTLAKKDRHLSESHSVEEARSRSSHKRD